MARGAIEQRLNNHNVLPCESVSCWNVVSVEPGAEHGSSSGRLLLFGLRPGVILLVQKFSRIKEMEMKSKEIYGEGRGQQNYSPVLSMHMGWM